jgi:hypothetical protein
MEAFVLRALFALGGDIEEFASGPYATERKCEEAMRPFYRPDMEWDWYTVRCMTFAEYQRHYSYLPLRGVR